MLKIIKYSIINQQVNKQPSLSNMASDHVPGDLVQMVWEDKLDEVTTLLGNGLDINAKNNHGDNPLDIATNKGIKLVYLIYLVEMK